MGVIFTFLSLSLHPIPNCSVVYKGSCCRQVATSRVSSPQNLKEEKMGRRTALHIPNFSDPLVPVSNKKGLAPSFCFT